MPSTDAALDFSGCTACVADQIVARLPLTSATAHDDPDRAVHLIRERRRSPRRRPARRPTRPRRRRESTSSVSRDGCVRRKARPPAAREAGCRASHAPRAFAAACSACHGFSATTPTKSFLTTTRTTPGMPAPMPRRRERPWRQGAAVGRPGRAACPARARRARTPGGRSPAPANRRAAPDVAEGLPFRAGLRRARRSAAARSGGRR